MRENISKIAKVATEYQKYTEITKYVTNTDIFCSKIWVKLLFMLYALIQFTFYSFYTENSNILVIQNNLGRFEYLLRTFQENAKSI